MNRWVGFALFLLFVMVFRLSDVVYLADMQQMVGYRQWLAEDVQLMGYASFIGMTMIFPILFRLKFRLTTRKILTGVTLTLAAMNVAFIYVSFVPLLVVFAFISGAIRIWGMFECMSSIMTGITPKRDFAVFFPVIYFMVLGFIQLTGFVATHLTYLWGWQAMNVFDVFLLLSVCLLVRLLMRDIHLMPPQPLYGIDWLGALLWVLVLGCIAFVATYGEHYEWWSERYIRLGSALALLFLAINLGRMGHIRHPYISYGLFRYPTIGPMLLMFALLCLLSATQTTLQNTLTAGLLHWQPVTLVRLNLVQFLGVAVGALFSWQALVRLGWTYRQLTFVGFLFTGCYVAAMYFLVDLGTNIEAFYLPVFFMGFGSVTIYVAVTVYAQKVIPFSHFFQGLCVLGFVRTGVGNPIAGALVGHALRRQYIAHADLLGSEMAAGGVDQSAWLHAQAMMGAIKELYGLAVVVAIIALAVVLLTRFKRTDSPPQRA